MRWFRYIREEGVLDIPLLPSHLCKRGKVKDSADGERLGKKITRVAICVEHGVVLRRLSEEMPSSCAVRSLHARGTREQLATNCQTPCKGRAMETTATIAAAARSRPARCWRKSSGS